MNSNTRDIIDSQVLIETSWNVKKVESKQKPAKTEVLIETSWNVKSMESVVLSLLECCINRNIVECKVWQKRHD